LYYRCPLAVARLYQLCLTTAIRGRNYYAYEDDAYYEPSLVEVVDVFIHYTILGLDVLYEGKPLANDLWIFALSPLVVVSTRVPCMEGWLAFDEVVSLELADRGRVAYT